MKNNIRIIVLGILLISPWVKANENVHFFWIEPSTGINSFNQTLTTLKGFYGINSWIVGISKTSAEEQDGSNKYRDYHNSQMLDNKTARQFSEGYEEVNLLIGKRWFFNKLDLYITSGLGYIEGTDVDNCREKTLGQPQGSGPLSRGWFLSLDPNKQYDFLLCDVTLLDTISVPIEAGLRFGHIGGIGLHLKAAVNKTKIPVSIGISLPLGVFN